MDISILDIISRIETNQKELGITLYPKASENELLSFEQALGRKLPYDIRLFYSFANGFESAEDMFRIIPLDEAIGRSSTHLSNPSDFHIAEYMIYCDMWSISIDATDPKKYEIYHSKELVLTHSFAEFLNVFLDNDVYEFYKWRDRIIEAQ